DPEQYNACSLTTQVSLAVLTLVHPARLRPLNSPSDPGFASDCPANAGVIATNANTVTTDKMNVVFIKQGLDRVSEWGSALRCPATWAERHPTQMSRAG